MIKNKREFKKYVEAIGSSLCEEMMVAFYNIEGANQDEISKAIGVVLGAVAEAKNNANIFFDRGVAAFETRKEYNKAKETFFKELFKKIDSDFTGKVNEALKLFNESIPASAKEENKKAVANS